MGTVRGWLVPAVLQGFRTEPLPVGIGSFRVVSGAIDIEAV